MSEKPMETVVQSDGLDVVEVDLANLREDAERIQQGLEPIDRSGPPKKPKPDEEDADATETDEEDDNESRLSDSDDSEAEEVSEDEVSEDSDLSESDEEESEEGEEADLEDPEREDPKEASRRKRNAKKAKALARSWENADRRHREADARERALAQREAELAQREAVLPASPDDPLPKYTVVEVAESVSEFLDEGDLDTAKALVTQMAQKAEAMAKQRVNSLSNPVFAEAWNEARKQAVRDNPELSDTKSPLYQAASSLLEGDWSALFTSHPSGVLGAVEVAKLVLQAGSASKLSDEVKRLEAENKALKAKTRVSGSSRTSREQRSSDEKFKALPVEDQIAGLYRMARGG